MAHDPSPPPTPPTGPDTARLFLALWPDADTCRGLQRWQRAIAWPVDTRPTPAADLHLTLHFIGAVPRTRLPALAAGLAVRATEPMALRLGRFSVWRGGVAVLQPVEDGALPPPLLALHAALADALRKLDLPVEPRPFRPHVTLARHAGGAALTRAAQAVHWRCHGGYVLAESAGGYRVLQRYGPV